MTMNSNWVNIILEWSFISGQDVEHTVFMYGMDNNGDNENSMVSLQIVAQI